MRKTNGESLMHFPVEPPIITAGWTYNDGGAHNAIDFRASIGTPVYAAEDAFVEEVFKWDGKTKTGKQSYGNMVLLRHNKWSKGILQTRYAHLSKICVEHNQIVREGDIIGFTGDTGYTKGAHLHFEVIYKGVRVNPLNWLTAAFSCANDTVKAHLGHYKSVT